MNKLNKLLSRERKALEEECHRHRVARDCYPDECDTCGIAEKLRELIDIREKHVWHRFPQLKPPENGEYLVLVRGSDGRTYIDIAVYPMFESCVTAWMPMPDREEGSR